MQDAEARLPAEPDTTDSNACRIAVRLPTGGSLKMLRSLSCKAAMLQGSYLELKAPASTLVSVISEMWHVSVSVKLLAWLGDADIWHGLALKRLLYSAQFRLRRRNSGELCCQPGAKKDPAPTLFTPPQSPKSAGCPPKMFSSTRSGAQIKDTGSSVNIYAPPYLAHTNTQTRRIAFQGMGMTKPLWEPKQFSWGN
eukprot:1150032-Pelagomonas_calceolata.AAC.3